MESLNLLKPDEACLSHTALTRLIELGTETIDEVEWSTVAQLSIQKSINSFNTHTEAAIKECLPSPNFPLAKIKKYYTYTKFYKN